jgi:hypothetical protein
MAHHLNKETIARGNAALLQFLLLGGFAACIIGALVFDITRWMM